MGKITPSIFLFFIWRLLKNFILFCQLRLVWNKATIMRHPWGSNTHYRKRDNISMSRWFQKIFTEEKQLQYWADVTSLRPIQILTLCAFGSLVLVYFLINIFCLLVALRYWTIFLHFTVFFSVSFSIFVFLSFCPFCSLFYTLSWIYLH